MKRQTKSRKVFPLIRPKAYNPSDGTGRGTIRKTVFTLIGPKDHEGNDNSRREQTHRAAFTLIELIVVMAVIGILVLLAAPKLLGYTERAQETKHIHTAKVIETALEAYLINGGEFPTNLEVVDPTSLSEAATNKNLIGVDGYISTLDGETYYELTYDFIKKLDVKLSAQTELFLEAMASSAPTAVYASEKGITLVDKEKTLKGYESQPGENPSETTPSQIKPTDISFTTANRSVSIGKTAKIELVYVPENATVRDVTFESANPGIATVDNEGNITGVSAGTTQITFENIDKSITKSITITVTEPFVAKDFIYTGTGQTFVVPESGRYSLEVWGASGGDNKTKFGGKGGYSKAEFNLTAGDVLYLYAGETGKRSSTIASFNGGGKGGRTKDAFNSSITTDEVGGGGGSDIRINGVELSNRILIAGGGGAASSYYAGGNGGGANQVGKDGGSAGTTDRPPAGGGTLISGGLFAWSRTGGLPGELWKGGDGVLGNATYQGGGGGGGGYYGGASGTDMSAGGGGSGYANTSLAIPGTIVGTTGINTGNGKVKVTLIEN